MGENVALLMVQFAPAVTVAPQVEVMPNSALAFIDLIVSAVEPLFVRVTVSGELFVPTACVLKFSGNVGERLTTPVLSITKTLSA